MHSTALLLGFCQFLFMAAAAVGISFNGLVGAELAASSMLATFPFLFLTGSTALLTLILPKLFASLGYRGGFFLGAVLGVLGGLLCAWAVYAQSFWLFCLACALIGGYQASALYYRFAAADAVAAPDKSNALAWVLSGGILAALIGPWLGSRGLHFFQTEYLGSYLLTALLALMAFPVLAVLPMPPRKTTPSHSTPVPFRLLLRHPTLFPAVLFCAGGYGVMMYVMFATPLAMYHGGFEAHDAASVIQWHLLGMFAPSLFTGKSIGRFGAYRVAVLGCVVLGLGCAVALSGDSLTVFHSALLLIGMGWNFMYMGGSTLLAQVNDDQVRSRLQALNEFFTFAVMTLSAGATGWLYYQLGWQKLLGSTLGLLAAITFMVILRHRKSPLATGVLG